MQKLKPWENTWVQAHSQHLVNSYQKITGNNLFPHCNTLQDLAYLLYHAPFVVVSHGVEAIPVFNYGNQMALQLWELSWDAFTQLPSKYSAPEVSQEERNYLLQQAAEKGYIEDYHGIRMSSTGNLFTIQGVLLWNLTTEGYPKGQAALFRHWEPMV